MFTTKMAQIAGASAHLKARLFAQHQQAQAAILSDLPATPLVTEHQAAVLTPAPQGVNLTPWNTLDLAAISLPA